MEHDRARAGYSLDRLDALVWGLAELLVEPRPQWDIFEVIQRAEEPQRARQPPRPPQREYAIGCVEWATPAKRGDDAVS